MTEKQTPKPEDFENNSPWIHQLNRTRPLAHLQYDINTDLAIIGGGIAGVATAYYALKKTKLNVVLIEAGKIAHAATGHNAGQLVSYFERPFSDLVKHFGLEMAAEGQMAIESAWGLLEDIFKDAHLQTPLSLFTGYAAARDIEEVLVHVKNNSFRRKAGLGPELITVAEEKVPANAIPKRYNSLFAYLPHRQILDLLETDDERYVAALPSRKGCMNSAVFCEELIGYLLEKYPSRFTITEHTPIHQANLEKEVAILVGDHRVITAKKVILCTNGFERITLLNKSGKQINTQFHHMIRGSVGYMAAYIDDLGRNPAAISYLPSKQKTNDAFTAEPYYYVTRRPFNDAGTSYNLVCVGGPESLMDDTNNYHHTHPYPAEAQAQIDKFLHSTYKYAPKGDIEYRFKWHGLMGYTPTGVRIIGPEPHNPVLLYNLGCNGAGLLHSIYGGKKISDFLLGKKLKASIFDPQASEDRPDIDVPRSPK